MENFYLTVNTEIIWDNSTESIPEIIRRKVEKRWKRDLEMTLNKKEKKGSILISIEENLQPEKFYWKIEKNILRIGAGDDLGIIYAMLYISEEYLGILPFWFWNDQIFYKKEEIKISKIEYHSEEYAVRYRGWCIEDAILLEDWNKRLKDIDIWEMVLETLLRLRGNMIFFKEEQDDVYINCVEEMGLWNIISYTNIKENISKVEWNEKKIIWNITDGWKEKAQEKIQKQYQQKGEKEPICYIDLKERDVDLYKKEEIKIPENIIKVYSNNEYGKIIFEEEKNDLEEEIIIEGQNGIYYQMFSYENKAASYLTMPSNSPEFIANELTEAFACGADTFLLVNCSNIKPHVFILDFIAKLWRYGTSEPKEDNKEYIKSYYGREWEDIYRVFETYHQYMLCYDTKKGKIAGERFYHYLIKGLSCSWIKNDVMQREESVECVMGKKENLIEQMKWLEKVLLDGVDGLLLTYQRCYNLYEWLLEKDEGKSQIFYDSIYLQTAIYHFSGRGALEFCKGFGYYVSQKYEEAFACIGRSIELLECILEMLRKAQHDKWENFYQRDYYTDINLSIDCLERVRRFIRNLGEGPEYEKWERKYNQEKQWERDKEGHLKDDILYQNMKDILRPMGSWYVKVH